MHISRWNLKSVDEFRCSLRLNFKKRNTINCKRKIWGGIRKMLIFFANSNCKNLLIKTHHFDPISYLNKFHLDPTLCRWDPAYWKTLVACLDGKLNEIVTIRKERPMSSFTFKLFPVLFGSIYEQNISLKVLVDFRQSSH